MIEVVYTSRFLRQLNKLSPALQKEVEEKIMLFEKDHKDPLLRVHKLKGSLKGYLSFSVNYRYRIVFEWDDAHTAALLALGDHSVYD